MWVILAGVVASVIAAIMFFEEKWDSHVSGVNYEATTAKAVAQNIVIYATLAKQYAVAKKSYNTLIQKSAVDSFSTYSLNLRGDYRVTVVSYGTNSYYEIISWDNVQKTSNQLVISELMNLTGQQRSLKDTNIVPLIIVNSNCTAQIMNSHLGIVNKNLSGYKTLWNSICTSRIPSGFVVGKYNILVQVVR